MISIGDYKKYLADQITNVSAEIDLYNEYIVDRLNKNEDDKQSIKLLEAKLDAFRQAEIVFNEIPFEQTSLKKENKQISNKLEIDDILIAPFEYNTNDVINFKSVKIHINSNKEIAVKYGTGTYYSTVNNILKILYPVKVNSSFGLTWHNNNKTAIKMVRDYLATTDYDPDKGFYPFKITNTQVNYEEEKINDLD